MLGSEYLQIDLREVSWVCAVATQGSGQAQEWVTKYKVQVSRDGVAWNAIQENNTDKVKQPPQLYVMFHAIRISDLVDLWVITVESL